MPNWCECRLEVRGPAEDIDYFRRVHLCQATEYDRDGDGPEGRGGELCLSGSMPLDDYYDEAMRRYGMKWGASNSTLIWKSSDSLDYAFDTPWGPPLEWLKSIAPLFPTLSMELTWVEHGGAFCGFLNEKGCLEDFEYSPDNDSLPGWIQDSIIDMCEEGNSDDEEEEAPPTLSGARWQRLSGDDEGSAS